MKPQLKAYYLTQLAHWCQELLFLLLGLEKPRKDFQELFAHHLVTLWLVGCVSYYSRFLPETRHSCSDQLELLR